MNKLVKYFFKFIILAALVGGYMMTSKFIILAALVGWYMMTSDYGDSFIKEMTGKNR